MATPSQVINAILYKSLSYNLLVARTMEYSKAYEAYRDDIQREMT